jgi:gliding motility-associatede transport system auxiliary component
MTNGSNNKNNFIWKASLLSVWMGAAFAIGGLILLRINPSWTVAVTVLEAVALIQFIFFFVVHFETVKSFSSSRSTKLGLNSVLMVVIFLSIVGILNFIASRHTRRVDLSETNRFTLASQTEKVLKGLQRNVKITAFSQAQTGGEAQIRDLLESYGHETTRLSYEMIDPDKKPAVAKHYGITQYDTLVFESGKQETQVKEPTEQEITNAIIRVSKDERRKILFLKDNGEHSLDDKDRNGYSNVKEALTKQGYDVADWSLIGQDEVPRDAKVLVIAGPQKPFLPAEIQAVSNYLDKGGKVLALLDPQTQLGLDGFLAEWGVKLGKGIIVDTLSRLVGGGPTIPVVNSYPPHDITEGFELATFYPVAQSLSFDASRPNLEFKPLAKTTQNSWMKTDISGPEIRIDPKSDTQGPFILAGIVTSTKEASPPPEPAAQGAPQPGESDRPTLVVFGDSDFANNGAFYFSGNGDFFLNTVNFLAKESDLIAITPKEHQFSPLFLTRGQGQALLYVSLFIVPGTVLLTGFGIWRKRRRL